MDSVRNEPFDSQDYLALLHYRLDSSDRIIETDPMWDHFARQNCGQSSSTEEITGKSIWNYITGLETRSIYESLFRRVRDHHSQLLIPFRCDSPSLRRYMKLIIHPAISGNLDLYSLTVDEQPRPYHPLLDAGSPRSDDIIIICSWCKKLRISDSRWLELEEGVRELELFDRDLPMPRISHHICPDCLISLSNH